MSQVSITLNGRLYRLSCGAGQEARLRELAEHLERRIDRLAMDTRQFGDERLLVMAALLATDELLEARAQLEAVGFDERDSESAESAAAAGSAKNEHASGGDQIAPAASSVAPASAVPIATAGPVDGSSSPKPAAVGRNTLEARLAEARSARAAPTKVEGE